MSHYVNTCTSPIYLPFPSDVLEHLEKTRSDTLTFAQRKAITLCFTYGQPTSFDLLTATIEKFTAPENKWSGICSSIAYELSLICTNKDEFDNTIYELRRNRFGNLLEFPSPNQVRQYLKDHYTGDLTKSSRLLLANLIGKTQKCAAEIFDIAEEFDPLNAGSLNRCLLSIMQDIPYDPISEDLANIESLEEVVLKKVVPEPQRSEISDCDTTDSDSYYGSDVESDRDITESASEADSIDSDISDCETTDVPAPKKAHSRVHKKVVIKNIEKALNNYIWQK